MKDLEKIVRKRILRGQYITIEPNQNFFNFHNELVKYFNSNSMPQCNISLVTNGNEYCSFNTTVRKSEYVISIFGQNICKIKFLPHKNGIELHWLEMYQMGQGYGTTFMKAFTQISEKLNIKIYLIPADLNNGPKADPNRRREFYHRFNFRRLKDSRYWVN